MAQFVIPDLYCPFPSLLNPQHEQVQEHTLAWAKRFGLIQGETTLRYYLALAMSRGACRAYAKAGLEELYLICDWLCWGFFYDDQFDCSEYKTQLTFMHAVNDHLLALLLDTPGVSPQGPIAEALHDIWLRACRITLPTWQRRFAHHHDQFFAAQRWEAENRLHQHVPDIQTYISKRRYTGAAPVCSDFIELGEHFEVPAHIYASQRFQAVLQAAQNIVMRYNDVYSLQKDLAHDEVQNMIVIVQQKQGCSLQEALNRVCTMTETETRRFEELVQLLPTYPPPVDPPMRNYVADLGIWIRGTLDWHREALRYGEDVKYSEPGHYREEILPTE